MASEVVDYDPFAPKAKSTAKVTSNKGATSEVVDYDPFASQQQKAQATKPSGGVLRTGYGPVADKVANTMADVGEFIHPIVRQAGESVAPGLAGLGGAAAGAAAISPVAAAALALPGGPLIAGALELVGAGAGAYFGAEGIASVQDKLHQLVAPEDWKQRQIEKQQHPWATMAGGVIGGAVGLSPKAIVDPTARFINTAMRARAAAGVTQAGMSAGTQYATTGHIDPVETVVAGATGVAMPGVNPLGRPFAAAGHAIGSIGQGKKTTPTRDPDLTPPSKDAPPEVKEAFLKEMLKRKAEQDANARLVETAIRNKETGEIEKMGPKHDEARKAETADTHDQGFLDEYGNFLDRKEAWNRAKKTGQIPEEQTPEHPQDGLHSGDMRKAGVKEFEMGYKYGAPPKTREEFKDAIKKSEDESLSLDIDLAIAENSGNEAEVKKIQAEIDAHDKAHQQLLADMPKVKFADPLRPTWNELHDVLWSAKSYGEAIDALTAHGVGGKGQQLLMKALNRSSYIRNAAFKLHDGLITFTDPTGVTRNDAIGLYTPYDPTTKGGHEVTLGKTDTSDSGLNTFLHEGIHAATHALIEAGNTKAAKTLNNLFEKYKNQAQAEGDADHYGFTDVHEFISEAFTKDSFRKKLSSYATDPNLKPSKFNNLWNSFKEAIRESLGIEDRTALDDVLDQGIKLIEKTRTKPPTSLEGRQPPKTSLGSRVEKESTPSNISSLDDKRFQKKQETRKRFEEQINSSIDELVHNNLAGWPTILKDDFSRELKGLMTPLEMFDKYYSKEIPGELNHSVFIQDAKRYLEEQAGYGNKFAERTLAGEAQGPRSLASIGDDTSSSVSKAAEKVDPRSIPFDREEDFYNHAVNIYRVHGEEAAVKFFEDWNAYKKEQAIPVPKNNQELDDSLHQSDTMQSRDKSEHVTSYKKNTDNGVTEEQRQQWFDMRERGEELPPEAKAILGDLDAENLALVRKAKSMGLEVGEEFESGQSRIRIFGGVTTSWKETIKELFANRTPFGEKVADQANSAIERKVYGLEGTDRTVEIHRIAEDKKLKYKDEQGNWVQRDVEPGTEIWEWTVDETGRKTKQILGLSNDINFKLGDKFKGKDGTEYTLRTGKVHDIENNSPYKYLHDAEASARLANMGLRKMVRDAELLQGMLKSDFFKKVGFGPDQPIDKLPKGWKVPNNIDRIPQLRGWHFDPKTAAIIEDFAKVWDNTLWMKLTNQVVKNLMLNPIPHMFNEVMHLWNARGFTGWIPGTGGLSRLAETGRQAWNDVGNQTQFYRDIMREGGSVLGADPRNNLFTELVINAGKQLNTDPPTRNAFESLAKKLGTTTGGLYNGLSRKSQQAMWFTRDVMYVQYIREIMKLNEQRTGKPMELKEAIQEAERHMPNYRMPSEILGSRGLSQVLKNPNVALFSRYHYGMVKSLVNTLKDINPQNLKSPESRQHFKDGVDTMLAIGVAMTALYPLMDWMAQQVFGEGAEQRRAGPYHLIHGAEQFAKGEKDATAMIWPMFTFNPMLLTLGQLAFNKKIFSGKQVYHPEDKAGDIASDVGKYLGGQIPQATPIVSAATEEGGAKSMLARQLDIKAPTPKQLEAQARSKEREKRAAKSRQTKREKGTYKP